MMRTKVLISFTVIFVFSTCLAWAGPKVNPGQWEITTKTAIAGLPSQSFTHKQCITENDMVPVNNDPNQDCQMKNMKTTSNSVSWEMTCNGEGGQMDGKGKVTYSGDTMEGNMEMAMKAMDMKIKSSFTGKRISSSCDEQESSVTYDSAPEMVEQEAVDEEPSEVESAIAQDAKDVGQAARDEAKQNTIEGVRNGVRGLFKKVFK